MIAAPTTAHAASCPWVGSTASPDQKADQVIAAMSVTDEVNLVTGTGGAYTGNIAANPALCIPALNLMDGPAGIGHSSFGVTQLPAPVAGAASFDTAAEQQYGTVVGQEVAGKGGNVSLGPTVNIVRDPRWGRAFESFGEDPYLAGKIGAAEITGVQNQGVMAQVKHLAAYNQETNRENTSSPLDDAVVDTRTMQETYLGAFQAAVNAGAASVMCSYNQVTTTTPGNESDWACQNNYLQNTVLKGQFGFPGFITSDWRATHSTAQAANYGLDMEMPGAGFFGSNLTSAVNSGQVPKSRLDDMAHRILREMFAFGLFDRPPTGSPDATVTSSAHTATALQVAEEGTVLLKNSNVLPLGSTTHSIAVIGDDAGPQTLSRGGGSAEVIPPYVVTPYQGIANRAARSGIGVSYASGPRNNGALPDIPASALGSVTGQYFNGTDLSGTPLATRTDDTVDFNWNGEPPVPGLGNSNWSAKWTGTLTPPTTGTYTFSLTSDDGSRLYVNGQQVIDMWQDQASTTRTGTISLTAGQPVSIEVDYFQGGGGSNVTLGWQPPGTPDALTQAKNAAQSADVAVVFAGTYEAEYDAVGGSGGDLASIDLSANDNNLIQQIAAVNPHTIVVLNNGSAVTMPWINQVAGVFEAWYPGQEGGNAIAALLFGDVNPSGKLPVTFPASLTDIPDSTAAQWPGTSDQVQYAEGSQVGYRWYDAQNKTPLFPFGYGLTYTSFGFSNLNVTGPDSSGTITATATVTNTGPVAGSEVAQLYLTSPASAGEPPKRLKGFSRVTLNPGDSTTVSFTLSQQDYSSWSTATNGWIAPSGTYTVSVGDSSRNLPLTGTFTVNGTNPSGETIAGVAANLCLDDKWASTQDNNPIYIYACNGTGAQNVQVIPDATDGTVTLHILGKCVDVQNGATDNYTLVQLYTCNPSGAQRWVPQPNGALKNPQSGRCLDDPGAVLDPTQLQIFDCNGTAAQAWRIP
ncbi:beta-glucosidase [Catenulispora sp. MAP5-51]|uniref:glycoside hydrolase family 3 C-terminal domain-containing protein n=1 Tax=Catenulispora sp. MAP5-51 TaxID=3156298 RepID=UPI0035173787